jgi:MinD superfamily P-loop ATPase
MSKIVFDNALCDRCNLCLAACRHGGLTVNEDRIILVESPDCLDCRTCEFICDRGAISWKYQVVLVENESVD